MCLAISAKILKKEGDVALADFGKVKKEIKIILTPDVKPGDKVLVHAGFSIQKIPKEAEEYELVFER